MLAKLIQLFVKKVEAYSVYIPESETARNYNAPTNARVDWDWSAIFKILNIINEYLRFFIIWAWFVAVIYIGIKMLMPWEEWKKHIKTIVTNAWVWFLIAILSFTIISIIVNLM